MVDQIVLYTQISELKMELLADCHRTVENDPCYDILFKQEKKYEYSVSTIYPDGSVTSKLTIFDLGWFSFAIKF